MTTEMAAGRCPSKDGPVSEPRWLDDTEAAAWNNLVQVLMLLPAALDRQLREEAGIPHPYYQILANLSDAPGGAIRMTDLARLVGTTSSRLSHAVASLEQRDWVRREACPTDKRGQICRLTDTGLAVLVAAAPGHVDQVRRLVFDRLTPDEIAQLAALTAKLNPAGDNPLAGRP
jgi:DNA-binding MarR family transcriptional regulator